MSIRSIKRRPALHHFILMASMVGLWRPYHAQAAELIRVPGGVMVRALAGWEQPGLLQVQVGRHGRPLAVNKDGADYLFSEKDLCAGARYRMTDNEENETIPWVPLENPCTRQAKDGVSLLVIGDTQDDHEAHRAAGIMLQRMTHEDPAIDLVLNLGDFVSWGGFLSEWRKYRQIASAYYSGQIPLVPVLGNHDGYGDPGAHNYSTLYATEPTAKRYYTLELAAAHLIVLNSNICTLSTADAASETAWLDHTLAILAGTKPIVVTYHHTGYTSSLGAIAMPCSPNYIRAHWVPLFGKYKVKLVLNGHDHFYERISVDGVEYLTVSAAAGHLAQPNIIHTKYSKKIISGHHTVTRVHIMGEGAFRVATWDSVSGTLLDDFSF